MLAAAIVGVGCNADDDEPGAAETGGSASSGGQAGNFASGDAGSAGASAGLPACGAEWPAAWVERESALFAAVNAVRTAGGTCDGVDYPPVAPISVDPVLTEVARCFAREQVLAGDEALLGAQADSALLARAQASSFDGVLSGYAGDIATDSVDEVVAGLLANPGQCAVVLSPTPTLGAIGYFEDPAQPVPSRWAGFMGTLPEDLPPWTQGPILGRQVELAGANLAGAEFGANVPGVFGIDYTYPTVDEIDYFVARGMNVFRIPFLWERMQPTLGGPLDPDELDRLRALVSAATATGATVVLDPHNYARYGGDQIGTTELSDAAFADLWERLASEFADDPLVMFGLMNEPHDLVGGTEAWLSAANAAIAAIRAVPAANRILVPGNDWTGAGSWPAGDNATVMLGVVDPDDNFVFEVHQYLDADSSGSGDECVSETIGTERVTAFTEWARTNGVRAFLGEFGAPATNTCLYALDDLLEYLGENQDVWLGFTYWAGGPWWGDYPLSVEPVDGVDAPQLGVLERFLTPP